VSARVTAVVAAAALAFGIGVGIAATVSTRAHEPTLIPATTVTTNPEREAMTAGEEAAYDRGFADGVEYESWFCVNEVES
jgi:hypothetical protein